MKIPVKPIKSTLIGGIIFLLPLVVVVVIVGKALELTGKLAAPLAAWIPMDTIGGFAVANLLSVMVMLLLCFCAGLVMRKTIFRNISESVESKLDAVYPRYTIIKGMTQRFREEGGEGDLVAVLAKFDDNAQIGFEIERSADGLVTVFLPGAPDPWSGTVVHMTEDRIEPLDVEFKILIRSLKRIGRGAAAILRPLENK